MGKFLMTSESVTEGHPDKVCDQISDAVLDEVLKEDQKGRVACETFITVGLVIVGGEITTTCWVDVPQLVRQVVGTIGYSHSRYGFDAASCAILNAIGKQSPDIAQGVDPGGAGDQGLMVGYACRETPELMPLPIMLAHRLTQRLAQVRKEKILDFLGPDGKSQVTVEYQDGIPRRVTTVILACQHTEEVLDKSGANMSQEAIQQIEEKVVRAVIKPDLLDDDVRILINRTGKFVIGGPQSDTGMTGRKIIVDTYGGAVPHGGGAFSGKDPTKVDRSATYMARYIAKNIIAAKLADKCTVQLAYVIGEPQPVSVMISTDGTGVVPDHRLEELVRKHFDLSPKAIIESLNLLRPIYRQTAAYGHFGREHPDFTWERTDRADDLKRG
ncbi:MAG: S-adenosylmethionine synthetase [candidate division Zixibacteria bacterium SM23_81]|nr:MAG: S-adenosylmethionine synthetase [candidate division Zixibacteria bacterium SM23_81]